MKTHWLFAVVLILFINCSGKSTKKDSIENQNVKVDNIAKEKAEAERLAKEKAEAEILASENNSQITDTTITVPSGNTDPIVVTDPDGNPLGVTLDFVNSAGGSVTVQAIGAMPPSDETTPWVDPDGNITDPVFPEKYYEITTDIEGDFLTDIGFDYLSLPGISNPSTLRLAKRPSNSGIEEAWTIIAVANTEIDESNGNVVAKNQTSFSQWAIISDESDNSFTDTQDLSKEEGQLKDGEKDGLWTYYDEKGVKEKEIVFDLGKDVSHTFFGEDGIKVKEINFEKNNDEVHTLFNENGTIAKEGKIIDGKEEGVWTTFDEKGLKKEETTFKQGQEDGLYSLWYENGLKKAEGPNKGKLRVGSWTWWYESGEKWKEGNYSDNGNRDGTWTIWKKGGDKLEESVYTDGNFISKKKY